MIPELLLQFFQSISLILMLVFAALNLVNPSLQLQLRFSVIPYSILMIASIVFTCVKCHQVEEDDWNQSGVVEGESNFGYHDIVSLMTVTGLLWKVVFCIQCILIAYKCDFPESYSWGVALWVIPIYISISTLMVIATSSFLLKRICTLRSDTNENLLIIFFFLNTLANLGFAIGLQIVIVDAFASISYTIYMRYFIWIVLITLAILAIIMTIMRSSILKTAKLPAQQATALQQVRTRLPPAIRLPQHLNQIHRRNNKSAVLKKMKMPVYDFPQYVRRTEEGNVYKPFEMTVNLPVQTKSLSPQITQGSNVASHQREATEGGGNAITEGSEAIPSERPLIEQPPLQVAPASPKNDSSSFCSICFNKPANAVFMPCCHGGICEECGAEVFLSTRKCCYCRKVTSEAKAIGNRSPVAHRCCWQEFQTSTHR